MDQLLERTGLAIRAGRAEQLVEALADELSNPPDDPFATETVCVESPGMARWVSAQLGARLGADTGADGICAGVEFPTLTQFAEHVTADLANVDRRADPWSRHMLSATVLRVMRESFDEPWFALVARHLGTPADDSKPGRWFVTADRVAGLFRRYWTYRPDLMVAWSALPSPRSTQVGADSAGEGWQAELWARVCDAIGSPTPLDLHRAACERLRSATESGQPARLAVFGLTLLNPRTLEFLNAFAQARRVNLYLIGPTTTDPAHPLVSALGRQGTSARAALCLPPPEQVAAADENTVLEALQADILADIPPRPRAGMADDSVQLHLCHGPDRQVEVLREVLTGLFAADPTLEPRDVAVLCPAPQVISPLVKAAFCLPLEAGPAHPGHRLRVQVVASSDTATNPLLELLIRIIDFVNGRATLPDLLALCAEPAVARRFQLAPDQLEDISGLFKASGMRWGLDASHRERFGLRDIGQNSLAAGLDRLLIGVALSEEHLPLVGGVLPLEGVESTQIAVVGRVAELIARLTDFSRKLDALRPVTEWANTLRKAIAGLTDTGSDQLWQQSALAGTLADLAQASDETSKWALGDVRSFLVAALRELPARNSFGNGSLMVTDFASLRDVPHRVVCVVGMDEQTFPTMTRVDGDDMLTVDPQPLDPDSRQADRQLFLQAILAARERLIIIGQGFDPATNTPVPWALPLLDFHEALRATAPGPEAFVQIDEPLYPYSPAAFAGPTGSFDRAGLAAALTQARPVAPGRLLGDLDPLPPGEITLRALMAFLRHPARELIRVRCGLPVFADDTVESEIPIELDGLQQWGIGDRVLKHLLGGGDQQTALDAERARGSVPPGVLGDAVLTKVGDQARQVQRVFDRLPGGVAVTHNVSAVIGDWTLTGTIETIGTQIQLVRYSRLTPSARIEAWLSLLLLQAALPETRWQAVVASQGVTGWQVGAMPPATHLERLLKIYARGMAAPLPLPLKTSFAYASKVGTDPDPRDACSLAWRDESSQDPWWRLFYPDFSDLWQAPNPTDLDLPADRTFFGTLARSLWAPILAAEVLHDRP